MAQTFEATLGCHMKCWYQDLDYSSCEEWKVEILWIEWIDSVSYRKAKNIAVAIDISKEKNVL